VTLSIVPLIALAGGIYAYITIGLIAKVRKSYVKASQVAEEVSLVMLGQTTLTN
jgi:ATP-binding cassette subfamily B (MDR/TAP) protein 1